MDQVPYTVERRLADAAKMAWTASGFWSLQVAHPGFSRRGERRIPEVAPSPRTSRTGKQDGPSRCGVGSASERADSERRGMGLAPTRAQMGLQKSAGWLF